ncbi:MAG: hypothetical protein JXR60_02200 [Bacteroidales bacterium]|nr:hypothetical protein [Bacteroidales bacterium]
MIKDILKIHDKFSIEIKQSYYSLFKRKRSIYQVITYLFIPNGLNINSQTYKKDMFYQDSRVNIRYNTPEYTLLELLSNYQSPLHRFIEKVEGLPNKANKSQLAEIETSGKILATVLSSALRNSNRKTRKLCKNKASIESVNAFLENIKRVLELYRSALNQLSEYEIETRKKNQVFFGDEYISNTVEHQLLILHNYILRSPSPCQVVLQNILSFIREEQRYKEKRYYGGVSLENMNHEFIIYKRSQLKKYVDSIFFLNKNIRKDGAIAEQTVFAFAAGLAMLFSTGVAFYYQQKYGNFTSTFFVALVLSYMLKDRIKSLIGNLFISRAHSFYFDYKIDISNANKHKVGSIRENFRFVPFNKLGPKIKAFRFTDRTLHSEDDLFGEHIIQYKKKIVINPKKLGQDLKDEHLNSIVDITRFNLFRFTYNMDNPKKSYFFVKDGELIKSEEDRVYHINIVQKFYTESGIEFKRYRVVLNRDGIKRIEKVKNDELSRVFPRKKSWFA